MKAKYSHKESKGLPGGPNEVFSYVTGVFSTDGYRSDSQDVNNPFNIIPSGNITMKERDGTPLRKGPLLGIDNLGNEQMMYPGMDYQFPGNEVTEWPMAQDGLEYEDLELTDEEIKEYRDGGHVVEELSKAHYGGDLPEHYHPHMNDPSKEKYYSTLDEKFANEKQNWNNYLDHPFYQQNAQTAWGDDAALNIQKQKDRIDKLDIGYENNYFMDRLHGSGVKGVFHTPKEEGGRGNITMRKSPSSSELHTIGHEIGHGTDMSPETIEGSAYEKAMYPEFSGYYPENLSLNSGYSKYYDPNNKGDPEFKEYLEDPTEFRTRLNHTKGVMIEDNFNWNEKSGEEISEWLEQNNHNYNSYHDLSGNNRMMLGTDALEEVDQISKYNYIKPIKYSDFMGDDYKDYANEDWRKAKGKDGNKVYKKAWKKGIRTPEQWWDRFQTNFNDDPELKKQFLEDKDGDGEPDLQLQKSLDTYGPEQDPKFLEHVFKKLAQEQSTPNEGQLPTAQIGKSNFLNLTPEEKENAFNYVQELKAKEVQRNLQDIKTIKAQQFLSNMTRSPLFEERMKKQTGKTPGAGQADNYAKEIRNNIKTLKYRDFNDPKQQSYIAANFKDDTIKPSAYYTPRSSDSYDWIDNLRYAAGNPWYKEAVANEHKVTIPYGDDYEDALAIHETSHGSTNANRNLPIRPEGMPEMTPKAQALYGALPGGNEWIDYYHDPTEQKARVDVIRHELKKAGIYDAFNEPFTEDTYLKAKKHVLSLPSSHLKTNMLDILHNYKKEDAVELMNSFVQNETENEGSIPTAQLGMEYEEKELTDFEIAKLRKGGYVVEELPMAQTGEETEPNMVHRNANWAAKVRAGLGPEYANYNDEQIREIYDQGNVMSSFGEDFVAPELDEVTITSETDKERRDAYLANAAKYFREEKPRLEKLKNFIASDGDWKWLSNQAQTIADYTINPIIDGVNYVAENPSETFKSTTGTLGSDVSTIRAISRGMGSLLRNEEISQEDKDIVKSWSHRADEDKTGLASVKDIWGNEAYSNMEGINHLINALPAPSMTKLGITKLNQITKKIANNISKKRYTTWYDDAATAADDVAYTPKRLQSENVPAVTEPNLPTQRPARPLVRQEPNPPETFNYNREFKTEPVNSPEINGPIGPQDIKDQFMNNWLDTWDHNMPFKDKMIDRATKNAYGNDFPTIAEFAGRMNRLPIIERAVEVAQYFNKMHEALRIETNGFKGWTPKEITKRPKREIKNVSGFTKEELLGDNTIIKDKDKVIKLSQEDFQQSIVTPDGDIIPYKKPNNVWPTDFTPMSIQEYVDKFNANIHVLNDIIKKNNKSDAVYEAVKIYPSGRLVFETPPGQKTKDMKLIPSGTSSFGTKITPGKWTGEVTDDMISSPRDIPGLEMSVTSQGVFPGAPRRGSKSYESINEYLKFLDLGRVKPGFNSQTTSSRGLWEDMIKKGKAIGFYANPNVVYGTMKKDGGEYEEMELTPFEITELRARGHRVDVM